MGMSRCGFLDSWAAVENGIEADVGEEDDARGAQDAAGTYTNHVPVLGGTNGCQLWC